MAERGEREVGTDGGKRGEGGRDRWRKKGRGGEGRMGEKGKRGGATSGGKMRDGVSAV